jgi:hypothetical protein
MRHCLAGISSCQRSASANCLSGRSANTQRRVSAHGISTVLARSGHQPETHGMHVVYGLFRNSWRKMEGDLPKARANQVER